MIILETGVDTSETMNDITQKIYGWPSPYGFSNLLPKSHLPPAKFLAFPAFRLHQPGWNQITPFKNRQKSQHIAQWHQKKMFLTYFFGFPFLSFLTFQTKKSPCPGPWAPPLCRHPVQHFEGGRGLQHPQDPLTLGQCQGARKGTRVGIPGAMAKWPFFRWKMGDKW